MNRHKGSNLMNENRLQDRDLFPKKDLQAHEDLQVQEEKRLLQSHLHQSTKTRMSTDEHREWLTLI